MIFPFREKVEKVEALSETAYFSPFVFFYASHLEAIDILILSSKKGEGTRTEIFKEIV